MGCEVKLGIKARRGSESARGGDGQAGDDGRGASGRRQGAWLGRRGRAGFVTAWRSGGTVGRRHGLGGMGARWDGAGVDGFDWVSSGHGDEGRVDGGGA